jgi:hypothetical protein
MISGLRPIASFVVGVAVLLGGVVGVSHSTTTDGGINDHSSGTRITHPAQFGSTTSSNSRHGAKGATSGFAYDDRSNLAYTNALLAVGFLAPQTARALPAFAVDAARMPTSPAT